MCVIRLVYMSRLFVNQSGLRRCEFADGCVIDVGFTQDKYNNALWGKVRVRVCDMTHSCVVQDTCRDPTHSLDDVVDRTNSHLRGGIFVDCFPHQEPCVRDFTTRCDRRISS